MTRLCSIEGCGRKLTFRTKKSRRRQSSDEHDLCEKCWRAAYQSAQQENRERLARKRTEAK